ncbi:hypothetical protein [Lysinibacillus sp. NPDC056232]
MKRQLQMFFVAKVKRQVQKSRTSIDGEMNGGFKLLFSGYPNTR